MEMCDSDGNSHLNQYFVSVRIIIFTQFNPLGPNTHIQILQTDLHTKCPFPYWLMERDQSIFILVIIYFNLQYY